MALSALKTEITLTFRLRPVGEDTISDPEGKLDTRAVDQLRSMIKAFPNGWLNDSRGNALQITMTVKKTVSRVDWTSIQDTLVTSIDRLFTGDAESTKPRTGPFPIALRFVQWDNPIDSPPRPIDASETSEGFDSSSPTMASAAATEPAQSVLPESIDEVAVRDIQRRIQTSQQEIIGKINKWLTGLEGKTFTADEKTRNLESVIRGIVRRAGCELLYNGEPVKLNFVMPERAAHVQVFLRGSGPSTRRVIYSKTLFPCLAVASAKD